MNGLGNYDHTPSFFNNSEYFEKYLGQTSYYRGLQKALSVVIERIQPKRILDMGFALGNTTFLFANQYTDIEFCGIDIRPDVVSKTNSLQEKRDFQGRDNASFIRADMKDFAQSEEMGTYDLIYMLYSFHHIEDPIENKETFLKNALKTMQRGAYLFIGETFLPEDESMTENLWKWRAEEGYASTYWNCLARSPKTKLEKAQEASVVSYNEERDAGIHVVNREDEYLVKRSWLVKKAKDIGFAIALDEPVNCIGDAVVLLRKI